jgi:hypothetical protein
VALARDFFFSGERQASQAPNKKASPTRDCVARDLRFFGLDFQAGANLRRRRNGLPFSVLLRG